MAKGKSGPPHKACARRRGKDNSSCSGKEVEHIAYICVIK